MELKSCQFTYLCKTIRYANMIEVRVWMGQMCVRARVCVCLVVTVRPVNVYKYSVGSYGNEWVMVRWILVHNFKAEFALHVLTFCHKISKEIIDKELILRNFKWYEMLVNIWAGLSDCQAVVECATSPMSSCMTLIILLLFSQCWLWCLMNVNLCHT